MMLVLLSLSTLFHDQRPAPAARCLTSCMRASTRVKVTVDRASDISESVVDAMLVETTAIWHTLGLDLERATPEGDVAATTVRVIITDEGVPAPNEPLGWIRFLTPRDP